MEKIICPHVSVDCVLFSIQEDNLSVLLTEMRDADNKSLGYKLPGSLIYEMEDLDAAANRVLTETTGLKRMPLRQFRSFGSPDRIRNKEDVEWLEESYKLEISRIITVAYLALCKSNRKVTVQALKNARWFSTDNLPKLPFDHKEIIEEALKEIRLWIEKVPSIVFEYLPLKFTALQLRHTYEVLYNKELDVRNFHKKMISLEYIVPTDDMEHGVSHRAARYYRFDKVKYNKQRSRINKN